MCSRIIKVLCDISPTSIFSCFLVKIYFKFNKQNKYIFVHCLQTVNLGTRTLIFCHYTTDFDPTHIF